MPGVSDIRSAFLDYFQKNGMTLTEPLRLRQQYIEVQHAVLMGGYPDADAAKHRLVRVIDESGEDYLYPQGFFASIELPQAIRRAVLAAV